MPERWLDEVWAVAEAVEAWRSVRFRPPVLRAVRDAAFLLGSV